MTKIGILNRGKGNKFIKNKFSNLDVGIQDEGEGTVAEGNTFNHEDQTESSSEDPDSRYSMRFSNLAFKIGTWPFQFVWKLALDIVGDARNKVVTVIGSLVALIILLYFFRWLAS